VHVDHVLELDGGKPVKVRRHFVDLGGTSAMEMGEMSRESELESPWKGVTLELTLEDGQVAAKVVAGTEPDGEGVLDGHAIGLCLDGFLPKGAVEDGAEWELDNAGIQRALRLDLQRKLFPPPARPEGEARGGGGGGGGGRRGGGGGGGDSLLARSEWKGVAKYTGSEEHEGVLCHVITLELETSGEREIEAFGGGRRGGMPGLAPENLSTWSAKLEGKLWFDASAKRPMLLELEGQLKEETRMESERNGSTLRRHSVREGSIDYRVEIEDAPAEEQAADK
jgi:hypothetical protein